MRQHRGETGYRPQHDIEYIGGESEYCQQPVCIAFEYRLRKKLACKKHYQSGKNSVCGHRYAWVEPCKYRLVEEACYENTIDDKHNIIANKHRADEIIRMLIEHLQRKACKTKLVFVHLGKHAVARNKCNLHPGKECREQHCYENANY